MINKVLILLALSLSLASASPRQPQKPTNSTKFSNSRQPRPPSYLRPQPAPDRFDFFCEDNNVPDDNWFPHPWDCSFYIGCWGGETIIDWCDEGAIYEPGPRLSIGNCVPEIEECFPRDYLEWPWCPEFGSSELFLYPSVNCDIFYVCM